MQIKRLPNTKFYMLQRQIYLEMLDKNMTEKVHSFCEITRKNVIKSKTQNCVKQQNQQ